MRVRVKVRRRVGRKRVKIRSKEKALLPRRKNLEERGEGNPKEELQRKGEARNPGKPLQTHSRNLP